MGREWRGRSVNWEIVQDPTSPKKDKQIPKPSLGPLFRVDICSPFFKVGSMFCVHFWTLSC